ncbi:MAG: hypothetical protein U9N49_04030, partial [Campylobacterota bacterium]|nr:hypothetical protein [Campylobacterota bacterium]
IITAKTVESLGEDVDLEKELDSEFKINYKTDFYDFSISKEDDFIDSINIIISYDDTLIDDKSREEESVVAMYYNSKNNQYESELFTVDTEKNEVNITTTHLSLYGTVIGDKTKIGPFYVDTSKEGTRAAKITAVSVYGEGILSYQDQEVGVLNELFENDMIPGSKALEAGFSTSSAWLGFTSAVNTISGTVVYSSEFITSLSNAFTHVGLGASVLQLGFDFQNGDEKALYTNVLKNATYNTISYAGTSALQLSFAGVFFIDYALTTFATEALSLNADSWQEAYDICYARYYKKTNPEWYSEFNRLNRDIINPSHLGELIEATVYNNVFSVFEDPRLVDECRVDAGYLNYPALLSEELKNEIALNKKAEVLNTLNKGSVFDQMGTMKRIANADAFEKELEALKNMLNQVIRLTIETPVENGVAKYAGYTVKFFPLNEYAKQDSWEGIIPEDGTINTKFRLLGYMEVGSPDSIEIYDTKDALVETIELGTISPSMLLTIEGDVEDNVAYEICPLTFSGWLYMDLDSGISYTDSLVVQELELDPASMFICTYDDDNYLYTTYYREDREATLQEEWWSPFEASYPDGTTIFVDTHVKYRSDHIANTWERYDFNSTLGVYTLTDSGVLGE